MELTPELVARFTQALEASAFTHHVGVKVVSLAHDAVHTRLPYRRELERSHGILHGGVLFSLMDVTAGAMGAIAIGGFAQGVTNVTVQASSQFLEAVRGEDLACVARPVRAGKSIAFVDAEVTANGRPVARGSFVFKTARTSPRAPSGA